MTHVMLPNMVNDREIIILFRYFSYLSIVPSESTVLAFKHS